MRHYNLHKMSRYSVLLIVGTALVTWQLYGPRISALNNFKSNVDFDRSSTHINYAWYGGGDYHGIDDVTVIGKVAAGHTATLRLNPVRDCGKSSLCAVDAVDVPPSGLRPTPPLNGYPAGYKRIVLDVLQNKATRCQGWNPANTSNPAEFSRPERTLCRAPSGEFLYRYVKV